jgi:hypothetical protein
MSPEIIKRFQIQLLGSPFSYMNEQGVIVRGWIYDGMRYNDHNLR